MLQQTQVRTVIPYFENFVQKIPNLKILSNCSEKKILKLWEGLGYYRRAKNLRKTAKILIDKYKGKLPINFEEIIKLPGIGEYTANVLLALVYNQPRIAFDGNVKRVFSRVFAIDLEKSKKRIEKIIVRKFLTNRNGDLAEALMEFGSHICKPNNPLCFSCALKNNCKYHKGKKYLPIKKQRYEKKKKYNIYCYLKKERKEIALTNNKDLSFLNNFKIPELSINKQRKGWGYLCSYKNRISNINMDMNLFYKFVKNKPEKFNWYYIDKPNNEFIPSFTKKILKKISKIYR